MNLVESHTGLGQPQKGEGSQMAGKIYKCLMYFLHDCEADSACLVKLHYCLTTKV